MFKRIWHAGETPVLPATDNIVACPKARRLHFVSPKRDDLVFDFLKEFE